MNRRKEEIEKIVEAHLGHLGMFDSPSAEDLAGSRGRVYESLLAGNPGKVRQTVTMPRWRWFRPLIAVSGVTAMALAILVTSTVRNGSREIDLHAVVESAEGGVSLVSTGRALHDGDRIEAGNAVRANAGTGTTLRLPDGSRVEMRSKSELFWERVEDGLRIRLSQGSLIVNAAKQRTGHFYVQTKDVTVSVIGTVFTVNAAEEGSRVSVIEGEVRVQQGDIETKLRPGEHVSTVRMPELRAVKEEIAWSPKAEEHLALLQQSTASPLSQMPRLRFEEEAIRPCAPQQPQNLPPGARGGGGGGTIETTPGRFYVPCMTVVRLILASHPRVLNPEDPPEALLPTQPAPVPNSPEDLRGGPEWISTDRYTIEAITDGSTDVRTMTSVMLPEMLERRFQVKVHTETEQIPAFALTVADGGLKIKPYQEGDCLNGRGVVFPNPKPRCSRMTFGFVGPNARWEVGGNVLFAFARVSLKPAFDLPVINKTGNDTDKFALIFEYGPDEATPGARRQCQNVIQKLPDCAGRPTAPSIHTALKELGLKVEPIKAPREFIVVDRVERPSPN